MSEHVQINLDYIDYQSLFRIWRHTSKKLGKIAKSFIIFKSLLRLIFLKIRFIDQDQKKPKIINSYQRKDYSEFIDKLTDNNVIGKCNLGYEIGLGHKLRFIKDAVQQAKVNKLELNETLLLYFLIKNNDIFLEFIEKELVVILFAEMQLFENYIAQLAKQAGRYTIGLQHGFYSNDYSRPTVNSLNYQHIAVDEMLVWGSNTKELLMEHNPNLKVSIVGRPSTHFLSQQNFHLKGGFPSSYVAILDADEFSETNNKILDVASKLAQKDGVELFLKCHPSTNLKDNSLRRLILEDINDLGQAPHFIGYRSSLLLELVADEFLCMAIDGSPFLESKDKSEDNSVYWKKLDPKEVSNYLDCASTKAKTLTLEAISKYIS